MKKYMKYVMIFLCFMVLFYLSPISGDDWANYIAGSDGLRRSLGVALGMYFDWEGRLISRVFINILTYHKWLWNIVNAGVVTGTIFMSEKFGGKKKFIFPLAVLLILGMNPYMFSQVIVWLAGNITYMFIVPVLLFYIYFVLNNDKYNKWFVVIFSLVNLFGVMFVENMAVVFVIANIAILLYKYFKTKKIDKRIILYLVLSIIGTTAMLLSPGTRYRNSVENIEFNKLSIFGKIEYNLANFINFTFISNSLMLVMMSISSYLMINNNFKRKRDLKLRILLICFMLIVPLMTIPSYLFSVVGVNNILSIFSNASNIFIIIYWIIYLVIYVWLLYKDDKKDLITLFIFLLGLSSNIVMLISPTWGYRTTLFTYLMFSISSLRILDKYLKTEDVISYGSYGVVGLVGLLYFVFYINIYRCQLNVEKSIKEQLKSNSQIIYVDEFPYYAPCNINPGNSFHMEKFKLYYNIPLDTEVKLVEGKWKYLIIYK